MPEPGNSQALNRYSYTYNNPLRYTDPSGHEASDLQYLVPNWFDTAWHDEFVQKHHRPPEAVDYVYRFVTMGESSGYAAEDIMRSVTIAIGAGLTPSGPERWSQPFDQTGLRPGPQGDDRLFYGHNFRELRWGKVRIVYTDNGTRGELVRWLGGGGDNATTFGDSLSVFNRPLDFSNPRDRWWLMHELRHVMQAQQTGLNYLPMYILLSPLVALGHSMHPMEDDANRFADRSGVGPVYLDYAKPL